MLKSFITFALIVGSFNTPLFLVVAQAAPITSGLIFQYGFDDAAFITGNQATNTAPGSGGSGNGTVIDLNNDKSYVGVGRSGLASDKSLHASTGNYVRIANAQGFSPGVGNYTMSVDFFSFGDPVGERLIIAQSNSAFGEGTKLNARTQGGNNLYNLTIHDGSGPDEVLLSENGPSYAGRWQNLTGVVDRASGTAEMYIDGISVSTLSLTVIGSVDPAQDMLIGAFDAGSGGILVGETLIDNVQIWDRALSALEVATVADVVSEPGGFSALSGSDCSVGPNSSANMRVFCI